MLQLIRSYRKAQATATISAQTHDREMERPESDDSTGECVGAGTPGTDPTSCFSFEAGSCGVASSSVGDSTGVATDGTSVVGAIVGGCV